MRTKSGSISFEARTGRYKAQLTTPSGRIAKRFYTKQEAADWITKQQNSILNGTFVEPSAMTLGQWLVTWLRDYKKSNISQRTFETYVYLSEKCQPVANLPLQKLTPQTFQSFYAQLLESGKNPPLINKLHKVVKAALKKAMLIDLVPRNVLDAVDPPKEISKDEIQTFNHDELNAILQTAKNYNGGRYYALLLLAVTTGMRRGEILGLRWCDVNISKQEISINQNLQMSKVKGIIFNPPKTAAGRRTISVPEETIRQLLLLKKTRKVEKINGLIFITSTGNPYDPHNLATAWRRIVNRSGVPYRKFHTLRHTHATDLLADGVPIVEVAHRLGHAQVSHTLDIYAHALPRYDKEIANRVARLYLVK